MKLVLAILFLSFNISAETLMVSHKGIWKNHLYPQNTKIALERALENGFKGIEFDIYLSKDKQFFLAHDDKIKKVTNCKGKITELESKILKNCLVDKNTLLPISQVLVKKVKSPQPLTALEELNDLFKDSRLEFIWIDLKGKDKGLIEPMLDYLQGLESEVLEKLVINSTSSYITSELRNRFPMIRTSLEGKWGSEPLVDFDTYLSGVGLTHDMVSLNMGLYLGHEPLYYIFFRKKRFWNYVSLYMEEAKRRGVQTIGWTVNKKKKISKIKTYGVELLLTDNVNP